MNDQINDYVEAILNEILMGNISVLEGKRLLVEMCEIGIQKGKEIGGSEMLRELKAKGKWKLIEN